VARTIRTGLMTLGLLLVALPALAASSIENPLNDLIIPDPIPFPIVNELCDGDCASLPPTPPPYEDAFDFEYGAQVTRGGLDIKVETTGSVFLVGPVRAAEGIYLEAGRDITALGNSIFAADEIILHTNPRNDKDSIDLNFPIFGPLAPPTLPPSVDICACIRTISHLGVSVLDGDDLRVGRGDIRLEGDRVTAALTAYDPDEFATVGDKVGTFRLGWSISRNGDIYLDVSNTELRSLKIKAGRSIVMADSLTTVVPEPGTALLLALGLAGLSRRRRG